MKIAVLVSGGVDSSVALALLKEQGHEVTAFYLKIWLEDEVSYLGTCPWSEDLAYVEKVCEQLNVPLEIVPLQKEYWERVVAYMLAEIRAGRTPNPDVLCNQQIKFGAFLDAIDDRFDKVASGHYAQVREHNGHWILAQAPDPVKDQTYFLAYLSQRQLARVLFPIGHLTKAQVRDCAQRYDLANKNRKDSQGICFLGKLTFNDFLKHYAGEREGDFVEAETGSVLGRHKGFWFHTVGQRKGSGLGGGPWYVVAKNPESNIVYLSRHYYDEGKARNSFEVQGINWFAGVPPEVSRLHVKMRHGVRMVACTLVAKDATVAQVLLDERDQGIAAGQFAVFYEGSRCLGAGVITQPLPIIEP